MFHKDAIDQHNKLKKVKGLAGFKVNYAIKKNLALLKPEIDILTKQETEIEDITKPFKEAVNKEIVRLAGGKATVVEGKPGYVVPKDKVSAFEKFQLEQRKKYEKLFAKQEAEVKKYKKFIEETESPFSPWLIDIEDVPADINTEQMDAIFDLIKHE